MKALYLAGPMSGYPDFNRPAFAASAERLRAMGYFVLNPGTLNPDCDYRQALSVDLAWIIAHAEVVAFQEGWTKSPGARAEHALAEALMRDKSKPVTIWYLPEGFSEGKGFRIKKRFLLNGKDYTIPYRPQDDGLDFMPVRTPPAEWG